MNLPGAKAHLDKAIGQLFDPIQAHINGRYVEAPSLYQQLVESKAGQTGERCGGNAGMPLWPDALDLATRIDTRLHELNQGRGHDTYDRAYLLDVRTWKVEDTELVESLAVEMESWATAITNLINPQPKWSIPAPCPQCQHRWIHRPSAGEQIRQPALQLTPEGCQCMNHQCRAKWGPGQLEHLALVLGYEKPDGVLE